MNCSYCNLIFEWTSDYHFECSRWYFSDDNNDLIKQYWVEEESAIVTSCSFLNPRSLVATARKKKYKSSVRISISIGRNKWSTEPVISQIAYIDNHILLVLWTSGEFGQKYMLFTCSFSNFHGGILDNWYSSNIDSILVSSWLLLWLPFESLIFVYILWCGFSCYLSVLFEMFLLLNVIEVKF